MMNTPNATRKTVPVLVVLILALSLSNASGADFYVSPNGDDANAGTRASPLATLAQARDRIRDAKLPGREPVTVHLMDGVHCLADTFTLTAEDSGTADAPVVYRAENEGRAILSGATSLDKLDWRPYRDGIQQATIPDAILRNSAFDELWIGGTKLDMARYPNRDDSAPVFHGVTDLKTLNARAVGYRQPDTGYVHALHRNRWGSVHYRVIGFADDKLSLEGGWQQNRERAFKQDALMIENIFEELDSPGEWFLDRETGTLYVYPAAGMDLDAEPIYAVNLTNLIHVQGSESEPVRHVSFQGIELRHTRRVCLDGDDAWEDLLRGDWSIHRSGALFLEGTEHCTVQDCYFNQTGGNGIFFSNYNRHGQVVDSRFERLGESAVCFVGNYACTRDNPIGYAASERYDEMDVTPGPNGNDYPRHCTMDGCLVFAIGRYGKQTAGAFVSMAENITIRHNTIYHVPRSGITINDGCWGGHLIEYNDVFDTVIETGDHGPFNSWGRDRYWVTRHHSGKNYREPTVSQHGETITQQEARDRARLDNRTPTVIRNNRWWHGDSHTWGIDLDDGSSNYEVYNNLCLGCSVKLREGFYRRVENNILIGKEGVQFHVPFDHNSDTVAHNIIVLDQPAAYLFKKTSMEKMLDAERIDSNLFWSVAQHFDPSLPNTELARFQAAGIDVNSVSADPKFVDPANLDFRLQPDSPALKLGFQPFPLDRFGVTKKSLKTIAERAHREYNTFQPQAYWGDAARTRVLDAAARQNAARDRVYDFLGAKVKDLNTEAEKSAAGVGELRGVFVVDVPRGSKAAQVGINPGDAILAVEGRNIANSGELLSRTRRATTFRLHVIGATDRQVTVQQK